MSQIKKVVALSCSAKMGQAGGESQTDKFLHAFLDGFPAGQTRVFYPYKMNIAYCKACLDCWFKTPGICAISDDMTEINAALREADLIVWATPIYHMGFSAKMKTVIERTMCNFTIPIALDGEGQSRHEPRDMKKRQAILISTCSYPEPNTFDAVNAYFNANCKNSYWENAGEILVNTCMPGVPPAYYEAKMAAVKEAGAELARTGAIPAELLKKISAAQMPSAKYKETVNAIYSKIGGH